MVRHDGTTPTFSRTRVIPGLTGTAIVIAVALAIGVRGAAPAGAAAHMPPGPAVAAKHQASALTRCLRWARRSRLARRRARRRRACRHAAAQKQRRANPSRSALFGVSTGGAIPNEDPATLGRDLDADRRLGLRDQPAAADALRRAAEGYALAGQLLNERRARETLERLQRAQISA